MIYSVDDLFLQVDDLFLQVEASETGTCPALALTAMAKDPIGCADFRWWAQAELWATSGHAGAHQPLLNFAIPGRSSG
jgi:hypothetical protein